MGIMERFSGNHWPRILLQCSLLPWLTFYAMGSDSLMLVIKASILFVWVEALYIFGTVLRFNDGRPLAVAGIIWLVCAAVTIIVPDLFSPLFYRVGWTLGRGATGLTPEPSFLGISSAFLFAFSIQHYRYSSHETSSAFRIAAVTFFAACLLSLSLHAVAVLVCILAALRLYRLLAYSFLAGGAALLLNDGGVRILVLLKMLLSGGIGTLLQDASIAYRLTNLGVLASAFSLGAVPENFLGGGAITLLGTLGVVGACVIVIGFGFSTWFTSLIETRRSIPLLLLYSTLIIIGPFSNPFAWIFLGSRAVNNDRESS